MSVIILLGSVTCTRGELIAKAVMPKYFKTLIVTLIFYSISFLCPSTSHLGLL